jgi:hypothetical protein
MKKTLEQKKQDPIVTFRSCRQNEGEVAALEQTEWQISKSGLKQDQVHNSVAKSIVSSSTVGNRFNSNSEINRQIESRTGK